jgi:hypothetical protein
MKTTKKTAEIYQHLVYAGGVSHSYSERGNDYFGKYKVLLVETCVMLPKQ